MAAEAMVALLPEGELSEVTVRSADGAAGVAGFGAEATAVLGPACAAGSRAGTATGAGSVTGSGTVWTTGS